MHCSEVAGGAEKTRAVTALVFSMVPADVGLAGRMPIILSY
jgi:hypothetical protein